MHQLNGTTARAARSIPYLILLRGGFALRGGSHPPPVVSYTAISPSPCGCLFSVALSIVRHHSAPSAL